MKNFNIRKKSYNLFVFFIWFIPILGTGFYSRFYHYGLDIIIIKVLIFASIVLGALLIITRKKIELSSNILSAIVIIYILALISDPLEYRLVIFAMSYALLIHFLSVNNYQLIVKQYFLTCKLIILFSFVDLVSFYILGGHLIAWREPVVSGIGIPRLQTIFDEPSHQVVYLLPALMYKINLFLKSRISLRILLAYLFPVVMTITATSAIALVFAAIFFVIKMKGKWLNKIVIMLLALIVNFIFFDAFFYKIYYIFFPEFLTTAGEASSSSAMYSMLIDVMFIGNSANIMDYLFGLGFFNTDFELIKYLDSENLMDYYVTTDYLNLRINPTGFRGNGLSKLLFGYGLLPLSLISYLIYKSRKYILNIGVSAFIIYSIFFMWLKLPQTIQFPLAIFFLFGLYQVKGNIQIRTRKKQNYEL